MILKLGRSAVISLAVLLSIGVTSAVPARQTITDLSKGATFTFDVGEALPPFTFKIIPKKQDMHPSQQDQGLRAIPAPTIGDIEVFRGHSKAPLQHLTGCDFSDMESPPEEHWFYTEDYNFDGYQDVYLMRFWGATGNTIGCIWLYDPKTGHFKYSEEFSKLDIKKLDPTTHRLLSESNASVGDWIREWYSVEDSHPVLIWSEAEDSEIGGPGSCQIRERQSGQMVTVLHVDGECPANAPSHSPF